VITTKGSTDSLLYGQVWSLCSRGYSDVYQQLLWRVLDANPQCTSPGCSFMDECIDS